MKVLLLPADNGGCRYYRMDEPAKAVREQFPDIEIETQTHLDVDGERSVGGTTTLRSVDPHGADVVVFQRPTNMMMLDALRLLQARGVACIVEIDDLLHGVSNAHAGHTDIVEEGAASRALAMAREADWVTVTTPALAKEYARHGRVSIIPNAVPRRIAELPPAFRRETGTGAVRIGWTGSVFTHPHDLQVIGTGLRTALERSTVPAQFVILGQAHGARERLGLRDEVPEIPWTASVDEYLTIIGNELDIGLAPLRDDRFNRAKSYLKPLEYAARGIYPIYSPLPEYRRLGVGRHVTSPKDWATWIERAVKSSYGRFELAKTVHGHVLLNHLTEHTAPLWVEAWKSALDVRAKSRTV